MKGGRVEELVLCLQECCLSETHILQLTQHYTKAKKQHLGDSRESSTGTETGL